MVDVDLVVVQPLNSIQMWSGLLADIPLGWQLCDGTNGTPNLIAKFLIGSASAIDPGVEGGEDDVVLSISEMPNHTHSTFATGGGAHGHTPSTNQLRRTPIDNQRMGSSPSGSFTSGLMDTVNGGWTIGVTGGSGHENKPPFFELAYIMRLS